MSEAEDGTGRSSAPWADEDGRLAVMAHSLLGTVTTVRGAIELAMSTEPVAMTRDSLLALALRRLDVMTEQLRRLAAGLPPEALAFLDDLNDGSSTVDLGEGTCVEVHSSFSNTWIPGFEIVEAVIGGYRVRRASDGSVLSGFVAAADLRAVPEHSPEPHNSS